MHDAEQGRGRALVVEDDGAVRELLVETLELRGFEVDAVASGEEALTLLARGPVPGVIVLDLRMPGMSGGELLGRLKRDPRWSRIRVAVVSGVPHRDAELPFEPDAYLEKPFEVEVLEEALHDMGAGAP